MTVKTKLPAAWALRRDDFRAGGLAGVRLRRAEDPSSSRTVSTVASQWQHMTLEDGSTVYLDARTKLKIDFSAERRLVHLLKGSAVFEVAKNTTPAVYGAHSHRRCHRGWYAIRVAINPGVTTTVSEGVVKVTPHGKLER